MLKKKTKSVYLNYVLDFILTPTDKWLPPIIKEASKQKTTIGHNTETSRLWGTEHQWIQHNSCIYSSEIITKEGAEIFQEVCSKTFSSGNDYTNMIEQQSIRGHIKEKGGIFMDSI